MPANCECVLHQASLRTLPPAKVLAAPAQCCCEPAPTESCASTDTAAAAAAAVAAAPQWWPWPAGVLGSWSALPYLLNSLHNRQGGSRKVCAAACTFVRELHRVQHAHTDCSCGHCWVHLAWLCKRSSLLALIVIVGVARCPSPQPGVQVGVAQVLHGRGVPLLHVDLTHACVVLVGAARQQQQEEAFVGAHARLGCCSCWGDSRGSEAVLCPAARPCWVLHRLQGTGSDSTYQPGGCRSGCTGRPSQLGTIHTLRAACSWPWRQPRRPC